MGRIGNIESAVTGGGRDRLDDQPALRRGEHPDAE